MESSVVARPEFYQDLANALRQRLEVITDRDLYRRDPAAHLERLKAASERIAALHAQLPTGADPQLAHYLQRCSYDKALAFVDEMGRPLGDSGTRP